LTDYDQKSVAKKHLLTGTGSVIRIKLCLKLN